MKRVMMFSGVLLLVAAALTVLLVMDKPKPRSPEEEWQPQKLAAGHEGGIEEFTLASNESTLQFVYQQDYEGYILHADGHEYPTEKFFVDRLLKIIIALEKTKLVALDPPDLTIYQLKPPVLSLTVKFADSPEKLELDIGKDNYTHDALFAKLKGESTVFLVPLDIVGFMGLPAKSYRSRSLMNFQPMDVASFEIKIADPALKASLQGPLEPKLVVQKQAKNEKPKWLIVSPINEEANFGFIDFLFQLLRVGQARDIIDPKPGELASFGLEPPKATLTMTMLSGQQQKVMFGRTTAEGQVYAMNTLGPEVYLIDQDKMNAILTFSGRVQTPLSEQREIQPTKVTVEYPREGLPTMELERLPDSRSYAVVGNPGANVQLGRLRRILKPLRGGDMMIIWHMEPYPRAQYGLDVPRMHVTMMEGDAVAVNVAFGNTATLDGKVVTYVEDLRRKCILTIGGDLLSDMPYGEREFTAPPKKRQEP